MHAEHISQNPHLEGRLNAEARLVGLGLGHMNGDAVAQQVPQ
nr:hypothetical protein [Pseudomonas cavernicola]